jgi:uroporphyrinogen decarboxylase
MSREHFRKFFKPPLKWQFELAMKYGCIPFQHCCGAIYELIPDFIDCGVRILNPIQTRAKGMEPERLKREFGKDICFHGSIDVQRSLPFGTCEEVRQEVRDRIRVLGPGGFVLGPSHNIQPDTPVENILALYVEARKSGCLR